MQRIKVWSSHHRLDLLTLAALALSVFLLWLPFGWNVSGLTDEWVYYGAMTGGHFNFVDLASLRPLSVTGIVLAYALTPDSFVGLNVLFALLLFARSFAVYLFTRELVPSAPVVATVTALLYVVHFGDLGWFWLVALNIGLSMLFTLLALWLLLRQLRRPVRWLWIVVAIFQALALTYEAAFPIILAAPLLLLVVARRIDRRVLVTAALWYLIPLVLTARYVVQTLSANQVYQSGQFTNAMAVDSPLTAMLNSMIRIYRRLLGGAFLDRYRDARETLPYLPYAAAIAAVTAATAFYSLRHQPPVWRRRELLAGGIAGLALIGVGFSGYLVSEYRDVDYRVYYFSAAGSALFFCTTLFGIAYGGKRLRQAVSVIATLFAIILVPRLVKLGLIAVAALTLFVPARWLLLIGITALVGLHASFTLWQHGLYAEAPLGQHWILSAMISQAPRPPDNTFIVLLDESADRRALLEFENRRDMLRGAIQYLYGNATLDAGFCIPGAGTFGYFRERCAFSPDGFETTFTAFGVEQPRTIPYDNLLVFTFDAAAGARLLTELPASVEGYAPLSIAGQGEPFPPRVWSALEDFPTSRPEQPINWPLLH